VARVIGQARAAVGQAPSSAGAWGRLGMALYVHSFADAAGTCFAEAERLDPGEARWPYFRGVILAEGDPEAAAGELRRAADLCGGVPDAPRLRLAELLLARGHLDEAGEEFGRALQQDPTDPRALLGLGRLCVRRGDPARGRPYLELAARDPHARKAAHVLLAEVCGRLGEQKAAEAHQQAAAGGDDPAWPDPFLAEAMQLQTGRKVFLVRANVLLEQGRLAESVAVSRQTVRDYPDADTAWLILGKALLQARDLPAAEEALRTALRLAPDSVEAHFHLGFAAYLRKDYPAAADAFGKAVGLKPDFPMGYYHLGYCRVEQGDRAGAVEAFRNALRCQPDLAPAHVALGELLLKDGRKAEAVEHLRLGVQLRPEDARARDLLARAQKQPGPPAAP
jgi:tetratricopeptide (TPR) repeat protein